MSRSRLIAAARAAVRDARKGSAAYDDADKAVDRLMEYGEEHDDDDAMLEADKLFERLEGI